MSVNRLGLFHQSPSGLSKLIHRKPKAYRICGTKIFQTKGRGIDIKDLFKLDDYTVFWDKIKERFRIAGIQE